MEGRRWPGPEYIVHAEFDAPLDFVYRWCTDYTPDDARYEDESYQRRILRRSREEVVYEDLEETRGGWVWARHVVRLLPPDRWHSDSIGSHREIRLDYRLSRLPQGRTRLTLTARRRRAGIGGKNPSKSQWETSVSKSWVKLGRALERDYRRGGSRRSA